MRAGSLDFPAYVGGICGQARRCGYGFFWLSGKAWRARRPRIPWPWGCDKSRLLEASLIQTLLPRNQIVP